MCQQIQCVTYCNMIVYILNLGDCRCRADCKTQTLSDRFRGMIMMCHVDFALAEEMFTSILRKQAIKMFINNCLD